MLVFVSTQPRASSLAEELVLSGVQNVDCLHAGMSRKEREDAVSRMRRGESWVMVTTEVMARGMDFKGVREVINYDFPQSVQSYVHRIGALPEWYLGVIEWLIDACRSYRTCWARGQGRHLLHGRGRSLPEDVRVLSYASLDGESLLSSIVILTMQHRERHSPVWIDRAGLDPQAAQAFQDEAARDG